VAITKEKRKKAYGEEKDCKTAEEKMRQKKKRINEGEKGGKGEDK
jgi:RecA/RadA recombinase